MEGGVLDALQPFEVAQEIASHIRGSAIFPETHTNYVSSIQQNLHGHYRTICFME